MSDLESWINSLIIDGFIVSKGDLKLQAGLVGYTLSKPLSIRISAEAVDKLRRRYRVDREIGGILLAEPIKNDNKNVLLVKRIRFIRNVSKEPQSKYLARGDRLNHTHRCLLGTKSGKHYIPIWFHSHPIKDPNQSEAIMSYFEMQNSPQDMKLAMRGITCNTLKKSLFFPSALTLVTSDQALFVGFYGGYVAPASLARAMAEIFQRPMIDLMGSAIDWGFGEGGSTWRKIGGVLGAAGAVVAAAASSMSLASGQPELVAQVNQMTLNFQKKEAEKNYLGITSGGELCITLPETPKERLVSS